MPHPVIPIIPAVAKPAPGDVPRLTSLPPLSLYVHVPWCVRKCPYCDFNSHELKAELPEAYYVAALIADLEASLPAIWGRRVSTIFIGGGTPSLLSVRAVDELLAAFRARLNIQADAEITLEANPGTVEAEKFAGFRAAGVTRVSIGVQSFNDRHLAALGRIHDSHEARRAVALALRHFDEVNLDLMYALPEQSLDEARQDLVLAASLGSSHLSAYHLTLEPNTRFHHDPPPVPDADLAADMQDMVEATLSAAGFEHYETSAFARPGHRCRHNLNYWTFGDYLGIGAGAHGKVSSAFGIVRDSRPRSPKAYLEAVAASQASVERRDLTAADLPFEFMMNALRLNQGFAPPLFAERTGLPLAVISQELRQAQQQGLLRQTPEAIAPTDHGRRFLNDLLGLFLQD